ncbi:MAG: hypothetical protein AAB584_00705 [Patescibacteria group bacterium]
MADLKFPNLDKTKKTTLYIQANIDLNIEIIANFGRRPKKDIIEEALIWYLKEKIGIPDPTQPPTLSWAPKSPQAIKA